MSRQVLPTALKDRKFKRTAVRGPARDPGRFSEDPRGPLAQPSGDTQAPPPRASVSPSENFRISVITPEMFVKGQTLGSYPRF